MKKNMLWLAVVGLLAVPALSRADEPLAPDSGMTKDQPMKMEKKATKPMKKHTKAMTKAMYKCPMDGTTSDKPGKCPKCGMDMVKVAPAPKAM